MTIDYTKIILQGSTNVILPKEGLAPTDPFVLKAVDGLGPPPIDVSLVRAMNGTGYYRNRSPQLRQVVARVGFNPQWGSGQTAADLRDILYGLLTPGGDDNMFFVLANESDVLTGNECWLSKLEIVPFSKDPEVQLTIDFASAFLDGTYTEFSISDHTEFILNNPGSAPTGLLFDISLSADQSSLEIENTNNNKTLHFTYAFLSGDRIILQTSVGSRSFKRDRSGTVINLVNNLSDDSAWIDLDPGDNNFTVSTGSYTVNGVSINPKYWGI